MTRFATIGCLLTLAILLPVHANKSRAAEVAELLDGNADSIIKELDNDRTGGHGTARVDQRYWYSGLGSVHVTPLQRFSSRITGWKYRVAEKPAEGEYRFIRFAWKKVGGTGIVLQLHNSERKGWEHRYVAGRNVHSWKAVEVAAKIPAEWTVVTRDLFKDFGAMTITGFALTPLDGEAGLFDHVYLGRTVADLDKATAAALGKKPLKRPLKPQRLEKLWANLNSRDLTVAGLAWRALVAGRKESVPFLKKQLAKMPKGAGRISRLIADLDSDDFATREKASTALEKLGGAARYELEHALKTTRSAEARKRIKDVLKAIGPGTSILPVADLRLLRVIRVLEHADTPAAREMLKALTKDALPSGLHVDAKQALERALKRKAK
jgi:hypothetical protein